MIKTLFYSINYKIIFPLAPGRGPGLWSSIVLKLDWMLGTTLRVFSAMILNGLGFNQRTLYLMPRFFQDQRGEGWV